MAEVARILAKGYLRLSIPPESRPRAAPADPRNAGIYTMFAHKGLDVPGQQSDESDPVG